MAETTTKPALIKVEVAYAKPDVQELVALEVESGTTVEQAVRRSGILESFPEIELGENQVGIFGKLTKLDTPLHDHDRVEIYRALIADAKQVRKQRAAEGKKTKKGGGEL